MNSIVAIGLGQLLSPGDAGDDGIASAVVNGEMDIASAVEALAELEDDELKQELVSVGLVGALTLFDWWRNRDTGETSDAADGSDDVDVAAEADDDVDADDVAEDTDSGSRLLTLPRLALLAIAGGIVFVVLKSRRNSETTQSTLDDVDVATSPTMDADDEMDEPIAEDTDASASTDSLVDEDAEDAEAAEVAEAAGPESEDIDTDVDDVEIDTDVGDGEDDEDDEDE